MTMSTFLVETVLLPDRKRRMETPAAIIKKTIEAAKSHSINPRRFFERVCFLETLQSVVFWHSAYDTRGLQSGYRDSFIDVANEVRPRAVRFFQKKRRIPGVEKSSHMFRVLDIPESGED